MKAPPEFVGLSNISAMENQTPNKAKANWELADPRTFLMQERFTKLLSGYCHIGIQFTQHPFVDTGPSHGGEISIPPLKKGERETGVIAKNIVPKAVANRMPQLGQIAARPNANRTRARTLTSAQICSYLALNWQRTDVEAGFTSRGYRFPTPQPTTAHVLLQPPLGTIAALLPCWLLNPDSPAGEILSLIAVPVSQTFSPLSVRMTQRGGGGQSDAVVESVIWIASLRNFITKGDPGYSK